MIVFFLVTAPIGSIKLNLINTHPRVLKDITLWDILQVCPVYTLDALVF